MREREKERERRIERERERERERRIERRREGEEDKKGRKGGAGSQIIAPGMRWAPGPGEVQR